MARRKSLTRDLDVLFADTAFWVAMTWRDDQHHQRAMTWVQWLDKEGARVVTTEAVFWEWLNAVADPETRATAAAGYRELHKEFGITVVPFQPRRIAEALELYAARRDKAWSLTDC